MKYDKDTGYEEQVYVCGCCGEFIKETQLIGIKTRDGHYILRCGVCSSSDIKLHVED